MTDNGMVDSAMAIDRRRLFFTANLAMFMIGLGFAVRANIASSLQAELFDRVDLAHSAAMVGTALGITFSGFALTLLFGSALVDLIGVRKVLVFAAIGFIAGSLLVGLASYLPIGSATYPLVLAGLLATGLGWGAVEAGSNPMVAAIYPDEKTHRLNILHAWWPAGIVVGGLLGIALGALHFAWQINLLILMVPALLLAYLALTTDFPVSERVARGISYGDMFRELFRQPMCFVWFACMMLTVASELAPGQWVDLVLSRVVGMRGILLLVYVSALMFVMRHFAGALVKRFSSVGLLLIGSVCTAIGLFSLSFANTPLTALLAATVWGVGVCYFYPTMVASVAERFPRGGALFMGITGFAGGMSIQYVLPELGAIFDRAKLAAAGGIDNFTKLTPNELDQVLHYASVQSFRAVAIIPLLLLPIFAFIAYRDRRVRRQNFATNTIG
ncbi:MAG TPA: MFS transporter [Spongiibacteraceae bacterium]|nr:MFS transporter [Spongiibacteraceae bacterium]